jgi:hypothetical protein
MTLDEDAFVGGGVGGGAPIYVVEDEYELKHADKKNHLNLIFLFVIYFPNSPHDKKIVTTFSEIL